MTCSVDGCDNPAAHLGYCSAHYQRWRRLGDPTAGGPLRSRGKPQAFEDGGDHLRIPLAGKLGEGKHALIDKTDAHRAAGIRWLLHNRGYVWGCTDGARVFLHHRILSPPPGREIDHINGDPLDNRFANLRVVTRGQQMQNKKKLNRHRNVYWDKRAERWFVKVHHDGKNHWGGYFDDVDAAVDAAAALRDKLFTHHVADRC